MPKPAYPLNIIILVSGNGSNLQAIMDAIETGHLPTHILSVISNRADAYALQRAYRAGIPIEVLPDVEFPTRKAFDDALKARLTAMNPDLIVLAGFMRILGDDLVQAFQGKMINIHPALLPKYRGLNTHAKALAAGDSEHGCSIHFVTEELDGGPVIAQITVPITPDDTEASLQKKVQIVEHQYYPKIIQWFVDDRLVMKNNQAILDGNPLPEQGKQYALEPAV